MNNDIKQAALDYAARGWHIFPAPQGEKKSHKSEKHSGTKWGATSDAAEIARDWAKWPQANVGIVTGPKSGFFVVEADTPQGHDVDGIGNLAALIDQNGPLPDTIEALSPSGSWHIYFKWPDGVDIANSAGKVAPGVDVRGNGGMVIGAPSVKPGAEKPYHWKNPPGLFELADCPEWLVQLCVKPQPKLSERAMPSGRAENTAWADAALRGEIGDLLAAPEGERNAALNTAAFSLAQIVAGGGLDEQAVRQRLSAAASGIGLDPSEIPATIESGFVAGLQSPRGPSADGSAAQAAIDSAFDGFDDTGPQKSTVEPFDLWGNFAPPELPRGLLPAVIEQFAFANGEQMGADPSGLAVSALVTCAAAIPDQVQIKVKRHDEWYESARIWVALVGLPSTKKSPVVSAAAAPLKRLDGQMMRDWQRRVSAFNSLSADERKGKKSPPQTRLRIEDTTVEAAEEVCGGSPWGILLYKDELSGFFGAMDKYNGGKGASADRAFWLQSYNGGEYARNRTGRGAAIIDNLSISLLGGIQPDAIRRIAGDAVDDGLLQRLFPITLRSATMGKDEPMPPVNSRYNSLIEKLRQLQPPGWMGTGVLEFDAGAQAIRRDLEARHLKLQSLETVNKKLASHIGKFDGAFARLCVIWHCVEYIEKTVLCDDPDFDGAELPAMVTEATAQRVADFLHRFLLAHSVAFYGGVLGLSDDHDRLTSIAGHVLAHKLERVTNRDVARGDRTMRGLKDYEVRPLLEQLAALGWLEQIPGPRPSSQPHWIVNPAVHTLFAETGRREAERRQEARATIQSLVGGQ